MSLSLTLKFQLLGAIAKPIGLLILLVNVQLNIRQEIAEAKNASGSQPISLAVLTKSSPGKVQSSRSLCPAQLGVAIEAITNRPQYIRARWGISIETLLSSQTLYSHDVKKYFIPASNVKLLITAAALHQLGSEFRIRTSVYGTKEGSLHIVGRGDPSLTNVHLRELTQQLSRQGIRQVRQLIAEDGYFQGYAINPNWEWEDVQADYGAPVNSLILNQNTVELKLLPQQLGQPLQVVWVDPTEATRWQIENKSVTAQPSEPVFISVSRNLTKPVLRITGQMGVNSKPESVALAVIDPTEHFLQHFRRALANEKINENADTRRLTQISKLNSINLRSSAGSLSGGNLRSELSKRGFVELAAVESPPLSKLLVETNQNSNNLYAEALLHTLGAKASNTPAHTNSIEVGLAVVKSTLTKLGVDPTSYVLADGSGLSRHNLVSPEALTQTLKAMAKSPEASVYRASLSVSGINGSLRNRFRNSAAQGIVRAKSGTMSGAVALSGYLDPPEYEPLVFSIIVNQSDQSPATLRQAIDEIVLLLTSLNRC